MAAFASCRRSGWVRLLVLILCALFIFATLSAQPAQALGVESVAVFGLASVLSAATAALGFKLASNEQGQATLQKMVQDFKTVAWATGFVLVGSKLNGLQNGMDYIKMQAQNGKTYLDSRVLAWVQQWLAENGVYNAGSLTWPSYELGSSISYSPRISYYDLLSLFPNESQELFNSLVSHYDLNLSNSVYEMTFEEDNDGTLRAHFVISDVFDNLTVQSTDGKLFVGGYSLYGRLYQVVKRPHSSSYEFDSLGANCFLWLNFYNYSSSTGPIFVTSNLGDVVSTSNSTGLSGTDTLGKDVIDLTLDQVLEKLKEWAQDWFDAGVDSATNAATGAQDLPLTVATGAATANPSIAEDGPLVWFPSFGVPVPTLRTGETDTKTVDQGKENASAAETSTVDVAENQTVIDSLVNWALNYISPDTGLFSKFPLCVPYDAYLLVTSSLGVDAVGSDSIFGASPGDLAGVVSQDIETYSDFHPIINIKHDFELDGVMYPLDITIDLTPWKPLVYFFREGMALLLVAELIGSEFKRIRGH